MGGWIGVEGVDADKLVVCTRSQVGVIRGESNGVDSARMVAHGGELLGPGVARIGSAEDRFRGPHSDVTICGARSANPLGCASKSLYTDP